MKIACFNIDVDPLPCYYAIHGLKYDRSQADPIYNYAIPRFLELLGRHDAKATFFITANNTDGASIDVFRRAIREGHEIGDHSYSHDYRLVKNDVDEIEADLRRNANFLIRHLGEKPVGFRAPGYNSNEKLVEALRRVGYIYDSSLFPSFSYYLAKWLIIQLKRLKGTPSSSFISSFRDAFGSYEPYFIGKCVSERRQSGDLVGIPMTTLMGPFGIPLIGTSAIVFPQFLFSFLLKLSGRRSFVNIEAHGIDLADAGESRLYDPLKDLQPDLKYSIDHKLKRFDEMLSHYRRRGFKFMTLREVAEMKLRGDL